MASPAVLTVETTTRCNLSCPSCFRRFDTLPEQDMPMALFEKLVTGKQFCVDTIHLFGMGEPLLDPHLYDRIALCRDRGIQTHLATNATLVDQEASQKLLDAGLCAITFSIDSTRPEVYERLRPGASYIATVKNVLGFLEARSGSKHKPMVFIQMLKNRVTQKEVGLARRFWSERGVDEVRTCYDEFNTCTDPPASGDRDASAHAPCMFLWQGPGLIRADGGIYPCCNAGLSGAPSANLAETSLFDFWTGDKMAAIRSRHISGRRFPGLDCYSCRSQKPVPSLAYLSYLTDGLSARRWGIRIERLAELTRWRLLYRETS
jgi:hypothetical protein